MFNLLYLPKERGGGQHGVDRPETPIFQTAPPNAQLIRELIEGEIKQKGKTIQTRPLNEIFDYTGQKMQAYQSQGNRRPEKKEG